MSIPTEEQRARFEATLLKMEQAAELHRRFINSPIGTTIATESGNIKSLPTLVKDVSDLNAEMALLITDITDGINTLVR